MSHGHAHRVHGKVSLQKAYNSFAFSYRVRSYFFGQISIGECEVLVKWLFGFFKIKNLPEISPTIVGVGSNGGTPSLHTADLLVHYKQANVGVARQLK